MSSIYENHICSGEIRSCRFCISHVQQAYEVYKLFQTSHWKLEKNYNNSQYYYETSQVFSSRTAGFTSFMPITSSMLYTIPQCQICQQNSQQTESQLLLSSLLAETSMYSNFGIDDESLSDDTIDIIDPSMFCKIELLEEDSIPPTLDNQASDCTVAEFSPEIQLAEQDLPSSPVPKENVNQNPSEIPTSNTSSEYKTQVDVQNLFKSSPPFEHSFQDSLSFHDELIPKIEESQKDNSMKCQCPNCSVDGGNNTKDSKGKLQHVCHVTECRKVFVYPKALKRHLDWHDRQKKFICAHCDKEFSQKRSISLHVRAHMTDNKRKKCQLSNFKVEDDKKIMDLDGKMQHICHIAWCKRVFVYPKALKKHLGWHDRQKKFFCAHCDKEFSHKQSISLHVRVHMTDNKPKKFRHSNCKVEDDKKIIALDTKMQHICHIAGCERVFVYPKVLKKHLEMHGSQKNFSCEHCDKVFFRKFSLTKHVRIHMRRSERKKCKSIYRSIKSGKKSRISNIKFLAYSKKLRKHLEEHDDQEKLFCPYCDKEFASQNIFKRHVKLHTNAKWNKRENYRRF